MPKKPELMLIEYRVTSSSRVKETGIKVSIGQKLGNSTCLHGLGLNLQPCGDKDTPDKEGLLVKRKSRGSQVKNGCNEVLGSLNRRKPSYMLTLDRKINRRSCRVGSI
jgi:hypothetical protein